MSDKRVALAPLGHQIRLLRQRRRWTLAALARRAGTSAPALHRYENGWDRFEVETLRRIATALGARLEIRLVASSPPVRATRRKSPSALVRQIAPLFWDRPLRQADLTRHPGWVVERVLTSGSRADVDVTRAYFGEEAFRLALRRRGVDARTRQYWRLILGEQDSAPQGP